MLGAVLRPSAPLPSPAPFVWRLGTLRWPVSVIVMLVLVVLTLFPIGNLIERTGPQVIQVDGQLVRTWSPSKAAAIVTTMPYKFRHEFANTAWIATLVATISVALAAWFAWISRTRPALSSTGWIFAAVGIAMPGPVIGLAVLTLLTALPPLPFFDLRESLWAPVIALLVRVLPLAFLALWWAMRTLDPEPLEAAALEGATSTRNWLSIALPQRWPLVLAIAIAAFVIASGDVSASLLLIPPGPHETVARRMFGMIHVGADDQVAGVGLVCWLGYVIAAITVLLLLDSSTRLRFRRFSRYPSGL